IPEWRTFWFARLELGVIYLRHSVVEAWWRRPLNAACDDIRPVDHLAIVVEARRLLAQGDDNYLPTHDVILVHELQIGLVRCVMGRGLLIQIVIALRAQEVYEHLDPVVYCLEVVQCAGRGE